jgi:hypothetical protein
MENGAPCSSPPFPWPTDDAQLARRSRQTAARRYRVRIVLQPSHVLVPSVCALCCAEQVFQKMQFGRAMYFIGASDRGAAPPPGWVVMTCPASGFRYFKNTETNERSWEDPRPMSERPPYRPDPRPIFRQECGGGGGGEGESHIRHRSDDALAQYQARSVSCCLPCASSSSWGCRRGSSSAFSSIVVLASGTDATNPPIPLELFEAMLGYLTPASLARARGVGKRWAEVIDGADDKLWKQHFDADGWVLGCGAWCSRAEYGRSHLRSAGDELDVVTLPSARNSFGCWREAYVQRAKHVIAGREHFPDGIHARLRPQLGVAARHVSLRALLRSVHPSPCRVLVLSITSSVQPPQLHNYDIIAFEPGEYSGACLGLRDGSSLRFDRPVSIIGLGELPTDVRLYFPISLQAPQDSRRRQAQAMVPSWICNVTVDVRSVEGAAPRRPRASPWVVRVGGAGVQTCAILEDAIFCGGTAQCVSVRSSYCAIRFSQMCWSRGDGVSVHSGSHCAVVESYIHSNACDGMSCTGSSVAKVVASQIVRNHGSGYQAANAAATDISSSRLFENHRYGVRLLHNSTTAIVECELGPNNAHGMLVSNRAHVLLRQCNVHHNTGLGLHMNSWAWVVIEGGTLVNNGKKSLKLSRYARNKQGYLTFVGTDRPVLQSKSPCMSSFGCKNRIEMVVASCFAVLYFVIAPWTLLLSLVLTDGFSQLFDDTMAATAVALHLGSGIVWLLCLPVVSTCGIELDANAPFAVRYIETIAGFSQVNGL